MSAVIDVSSDTLTSVRAIARARLGRDIAPSTIWRWLRKGCRGCRLEAVQVGGQWHTTPAAFGAFVAGQTAVALPPRADDAPTERSVATKAKLKAAGLLT